MLLQDINEIAGNMLGAIADFSVNLFGRENPTRDAIGAGVRTLGSIPDMSEEELGALAASGVIIGIETAAQKRLPLAVIGESQGFRSFSAFKRATGPAGEGQAWHHIVEQTPGNIGRFGAETIHNTGNLMKLPHGVGSIHARVSGYYSSIQPFTNGQTVRNG